MVSVCLPSDALLQHLPSYLGFSYLERGVSRPHGKEMQKSKMAVWERLTNSCEKIPHVQGKRNPSKKVGAKRGHQRADRLKPQSQETSQSDHSSTASSNSMKLSHALWGHPRWEGHVGEVWQNVVHWRREWQTTLVFLPWEPHEQYEKAKW